MSSFALRIASAEAHERAVVARLRENGWRAFAFGQGLLPPELRDVLRRFDTPMRWMPDIVAARDPFDVYDLVFVDAKAGEKWSQTGNHDVEQASAEAGKAWAQYSRCSYQFVFSDWSCATPFQVLQLGRPGPYRGSGSGTPFLLIARDRCLPFDAVFTSERERVSA